MFGLGGAGSRCARYGICRSPGLARSHFRPNARRSALRQARRPRPCARRLHNLSERHAPLIKLLAGSPLTVQSNAQKGKAVSAAVEQERDAEHFEEPHPALWRISLVVTRPTGVREIGGVSSTAERALDESQLWDAPPGYSLTNQAPPAPPPVTQVSSRRHTWAARLAFSAIAVAIAALLVLEWSAIS